MNSKETVKKSTVKKPIGKIVMTEGCLYKTIGNFSVINVLRDKDSTMKCTLVIEDKSFKAIYNDDGTISENSYVNMYDTIVIDHILYERFKNFNRYLFNIDFNTASTPSSAPAKVSADLSALVGTVVYEFSESMKNKMLKNSYKGSWRIEGIDHRFFFEKLIKEVAELYEAMIRYDNKDDYKKILDESSDVGNFAMMIYDLIKLKYEETNGKN